MTNPAIDPYLAQAMAQSLPADNEVRTGTVVGVDRVGGQLRVNVNGGIVDAGYLATYLPQIGHTVALVRQKAGWLCLGSLAGGGAAEDAAAPVPFSYADWAACTGAVTSASASYIPANSQIVSYPRTNARLPLLVGLWMTNFFSAAGNQQAEVGLRFTSASGAVLLDKTLGITYQTGTVAERHTGGGMAKIPASSLPNVETVTVQAIIRKYPLGAGNFQRVANDDGQSILIMELPG